MTAVNTSASAETGEPAPVANNPAKRSLWWSWTAPRSGPARLETAGSGFDTVLGVYTGSAVNALAPVAVNDDAQYQSTSCVTFPAVAGTTYAIAVDGYAGATGTVVLSGRQDVEGAIYRSDFATRPLGTNSLVGADGWQGFNTEDVTGTMLLNSSRPAAFLGWTVPPGSAAALSLPLNYTRPAAGAPAVSVLLDCHLEPGAGEGEQSYHVLLYNPAGDFLAGVEFDLAAGVVRRWDGTPGGRLATGFALPARTTMRLELWIDLAANRWEAWLGGAAIFTQQVFHAGAEPVELGSLSAAWTAETRPDASGAFFAFSALEIQPQATGVRPAVAQSGPGEFEATQDFFNVIALTWPEQPGATAYEVWRSGTADFAAATRLTTSAGTSFDDASAAAGVGYTYWVRALADGSVIRTDIVTGERAVRPAVRLMNISSRGSVKTGQPMIAGFVLHGTTTRRVLLRAVGPGLAAYGVDPAASRPYIKLVANRQTAETVLESRDGWDERPGVAELAAAMNSAGAFALAEASGDAAVVVELEPGLYTAEVGDLTGEGICLVEAYVLDDATARSTQGELVNISTRGHVGQGTEVLIAGLVVSGTESRRFLIRGVGPKLAEYGVIGVLENPGITLFAEGESAAFATNDDWSSDPIAAAETITAFAQTGAFPLTEGSADAAMVVQLDPGLYTVQLFPSTGAAGVGLVEVYEIR